MSAKYVHTNLVARDWRKLSAFYVAVFGCMPKPPERNLSGEWLDKATSLKDASIRGMHFQLPGCGADGPTLEIFQYAENEANENKRPNIEGFSHIAFAVDDVEAYLTLIVKNGGSSVGEVVKTEVAGVGAIHFAYARDPEGNIIEVQKWEKR
jgi:predicted enzyme related to lactoylglutathione lyase